MGYEGLSIYTSGPEQRRYDGFLLRDLVALANAGYLSVSPHGKSLDVVVLSSARQYRRDMQASAWERSLRRASRASVPLKYAGALVAGALLTQFANTVVWPWLRGLFSF